MDERSYNQPTFKDQPMENPLITSTLLKRLGFTEQWSNSLDMYVFQLDDIVLYESFGAYRYDHTGTILVTLEDLQDAIYEEYGEYLEY